jgi:hypothetical protein
MTHAHETPPPTTSEKEAEHERKEIRKAIDETEAPTRVEIKEADKAPRAKKPAKS